MGSLAESRRNLIVRFGRTMQLRRPVAGGQATTVTITAFASRYTPGEIEGAIQQGDERVQILHEEIAAAGWNGVRTSDWLLKDGKQQSIQGAIPGYEGSAVIGHVLWVRGT